MGAEGCVLLGEMLVQISIQSSGNVFAVKCCGESSLLLLSLEVTLLQLGSCTQLLKYENNLVFLACRRQGAFLGNRAPAVRSPRPRTARAVAGAEIRAAAPPATSVPRCPQAPGTCQSAPPGGGAHCGCTRPRELSAAAAADPGVWRSETPVRVSGSVGMATQPEMRQEKSRGAVASRASSPLSGCRSHRRRAGRRAGG